MRSERNIRQRKKMKRERRNKEGSHNEIKKKNEKK